MSSRFKKFTLLSSLCASLLCLYLSLKTPLPSPQKPLVFYSNQTDFFLNYTLKKAIKNAKNFVLIHTYALSDQNIIKLLNRKAQKPCSISIYTDSNTSRSERKKNQNFSWYIKKGRGLMHEKILMIDYKTAYLGTANLTYESLNRHDNMILGIYSPELSNYLFEHYQHRINNEKTPPKTLTINFQNLTIWFLPDIQEKALHYLISHIDKAREHIQIAMYTLTHPKIIESLIKAKKRGVLIEVYIDQSSARGASKTACEKLFLENIFCHLSGKQKLLHYKMMLIDNKNFIIGSSNWTKNAFKSNHDFFISINNLNKNQTTILKKVFNKIKKESFIYK